MFQLTRKIEYALIILHHMSVCDEENKVPSAEAPLYTVKSIAHTYGIPEIHSAKTFQLLCRNGIFQSKQGTKGGYRRVRPLKNISLYELIEILEGKFGIVRCMTATGHISHSELDCNYSPFCNITTAMQKLNDKLMHFYKNTTLDELLNTPAYSRKKSHQSEQPKVNNH